MASSSTFELNDTLQISKEQGFPEVLQIEKYILDKHIPEWIIGTDFEFTSKAGLRNFVAYPVRVFLVENYNGKWIYWWLCQIVETKIDYVKRETSWKYRITRLFNPGEMKQAFNLIDGRPEYDFFI